MKVAHFAVIVLGLPALLALYVGAAQAEPEKVPSIKEICFNGCSSRNPNAVPRLITQQLNSLEPDWAVAEQKSRDLVRMGKILGEHRPPRGLEAWRQRTDRYVAQATLVAEAVERRDKETALRQLRLVINCRDCHQAHK